mmetsp:Transcript_67198/g.160321  ORF Transcript_67198/g.160321 Transcript_67198/m.160321 type:complete len:276 (-) Transcript_67198:37-864(-)
MFVLMMSESLKVMSSSPRDPWSVMMAGRTCGGETATTVITIQSGRQKRGSSPMMITSSSVTLRRMSRASSANSSRSPVMLSSGAVSSLFVAAGNFSLKFSPERSTVGCGAPQPVSGVDSSLSVAACLHCRFVLQMLDMVASRAWGCLMRLAARNFASESSAMICPHLWHTHDRIFCSIVSMPQWNTGSSKLICPKCPGHVWSLPWHVAHRYCARGGTPSLASISPATFGLPRTSNLSCDLISATEKFLISSGPNSPNCTHRIFANSHPLLLVSCW